VVHIAGYTLLPYPGGYTRPRYELNHINPGGQRTQEDINHINPGGQRAQEGHLPYLTREARGPRKDIINITPEGGPEASFQDI